MKLTRRQSIVAGLATVTAAMGAGRTRAAETSADPTLEFAFEVVASLEAPLQLGNTGMGVRRIIGVTGGTVTGPKLNGIVLPGGADWQIVRADGVTEISARYTLQADDGALIERHRETGNAVQRSRRVERNLDDRDARRYDRLGDVNRFVGRNAP